READANHPKYKPLPYPRLPREGSKAKDSAEERSMGVHKHEVAVLGDLVPLVLVSSHDPEVTRREVLHSGVGVKQMFTLENYATQIVEDVHLGARVVFEIVTDRRRKFGNRAISRAASVIGSTAHLGSGRHEPKIKHRPKADLFLAPSVRIRGAKCPDCYVE